ncbi:MAG: CehA/McbA family metallohydrolase [Eubacteriales bacterium]|nr:CehA/McbA family metallohydrolase [Eubacteriales bacterium]
MKTSLEYYDIYPKVLRVGKRTAITIRPLGAHVAFHSEAQYQVRLVPMNETLLNVTGKQYETAQAVCSEGALQFEFCPRSEQQYIVLLLEKKQGQDWEKKCELRVYALEPDFFSLRPYRGDMHCHTCRSDGKEAPAIVAANYRKAGFDFLSITDHGQYAPSMEAIRTYEKIPMSFQLFPGEEVHPPKNNTHTVHFGGESSVNELFLQDPERYEREVDELEASLGIPDGLNKREYASLVWVYRKIREAGGLAIMAHPCWIQEEAYHVRRDMYRYLLKTHPFDALELTCGQSLEENQQQISLWQQMREEGNIVPVVGSSDSHGTVNSEWFGLSKMIVLAEDCTKNSLIDAVKKRRVAVLEQYHGEALPRVYGENRTVEFVLFLLTEYMPLHDELCFEEGRLMKEYACGSREAGGELARIGRRTQKLTEKYWAE